MTLKKPKLFIIAFLSFLNLYISYLCFISFRMQTRIDADFSKEQISIAYDEIDALFPIIPNISVSTIPLDSYKAYYYFRYGNNRKALSILSKIEKDNLNPYLFYVEYLKSLIFISSKQNDSALIYAEKAFYGWPKNINHYKLYNRLLVSSADTTAIINAFDKIDSIFYDRSQYGQVFINSLAAAKLSYIAKYDNKIIPTSKDLVGKWYEVYEMSNGDFTRLSKEMSFSGTTFETTGIEYDFILDKDSLLLFSKKKQNYIISKSIVYYDTIYKTLIISPSQSNGEKRDTYFKKAPLN